MRFIWNAAKSDWTLKHRSFSFADATRVFDDPLRLIERAKTKDGEERWLTVGVLPNSDPPVVVTVIYTERKINGKETIRIISARKADKHESRRVARLRENP
jgi:uncharacterized DUF497 family protein